MLSSLSTAALTERALVILLIACCGDMSVKGKKSISASLALLLSCLSSVLCSCRSYDCFSFGTLKPHVGSNHARGKDVQVSRARAHFYVVCEKVGSLWSWTNWKPFSAYEVNPAWVTAWWSVQTPSFAISIFLGGSGSGTALVLLTRLHQRKLSHSMYQKYLLQCRRSYRTLLLNAEAVQTAEKALALMLGLQVLDSVSASLGFLQLYCSTLLYLSA